MKTSIIVLLFVSFSFVVQAQQFWSWSDPVPLTDSSSNNTNPFLLRMEFSYPMKLMMVWEKSIDTNSTSLYLDNLLDTIPPYAIIAQEGVHYSNPQLFYGNWYNYDTLFFITYETNQNGNQDIYMIPYVTGDSLGAPFPFASTTEDETEVAVCYNEFGDKSNDFFSSSISWIQNGNLIVRNFWYGSQGYYFGQNIQIDSSNCTQPSINNYCVLTYAKQDISGNILKTSFCDQGNWSDPQILYDEADAMHPTSSLHSFIPYWSAKLGDEWTIMFEDGDIIYDITSEYPLKPAATTRVFDDGGPNSYVSTSYAIDGFDEILLSLNPYSLEFGNFTNSGTMNQNPQFFKGESDAFYYQWWDYLVWESYRNNHWQIWCSKNFNGYSGIEDIKDHDRIILARPNPFTHETTLTFELDKRSDVSIEAYDLQGRKVDIIANQNMGQGKHQLRWNAVGLPEGVYLIRMMINGNVYTSKVVKTR